MLRNLRLGTGPNSVCTGLFFTGLLAASIFNAVYAADIEFTPVQTETFSDPLGQSNAWGDYDNDGDLDLAVVFLNGPLRLYENRGTAGFVDVGQAVNLITNPGNARAVAWGDYDNDGDLDLYIAYADGVNPNVLMENQISNVLKKSHPNPKIQPNLKDWK